MRASFIDYLEIEEQMRETLGSSSKHIIARETARFVSLYEDSTGKKQLLELIERIKNL